MAIERRRALITKMLTSGIARTQEEIVEELAHAGEKATQATISRDLASLGAVRGPRGYQIFEPGSRPGAARAGNAAPTQDSEQARLVRAHALSIGIAHSIVVIKTAPGHAQLLASAFDRSPPGGVAGCVGGDDTIFLATTSPGAARSVARALRAQLRKDAS